MILIGLSESLLELDPLSNAASAWLERVLVLPDVPGVLLEDVDEELLEVLELSEEPPPWPWPPWPCPPCIAVASC